MVPSGYPQVHERDSLSARIEPTLPAGNAGNTNELSVCLDGAVEGTLQSCGETTTHWVSMPRFYRRFARGDRHRMSWRPAIIVSANLTGTSLGGQECS